MAANWHELMIPRHIMRPSIARNSEQLQDQRCSPTDIPLLQSTHPIACKLLQYYRTHFSSHWLQDAELAWVHRWLAVWSRLLANDQWRRNEINITGRGEPQRAETRSPYGPPGVLGEGAYRTSTLYQLGGLRERRELPQWGPGQSPSRQES